MTNKVSKFVNSSLLEKENEKTYNEKLLPIKDYNPSKMSKIKYLKTEKNEEALHQLQLKEKKKTYI